MGICLSSEEKELKERSTHIDRLIEEDSRRLSKECKILLLGSGESGKSTIVKQMKIIHQNGYSPEELHLFRPIIYKNILDCVKDLVLGFKTLNMKPDNASCQDFILNYPQYLTDFAFSGNFSPEFVNGINELYQNEKTQEVLDHTNEFYILDSCHYFFENIQRIGDPNFIPTVQDVLRARAKTTGIIETRFTMGQMHIHMFDVGG
ncbi:guanine nucleotide binding protein, alpha subunit, partial [Conidiobolus coronatus NRRL 28638]